MTFIARNVAMELCYAVSKPPHHSLIQKSGFDAIESALQAAYDAGVNAQPTGDDVRMAARMRWFIANVEPKHTGRSWSRMVEAAPFVRDRVYAGDTVAGYRMGVWEWRLVGGFKNVVDAIDSQLGVEIPMGVE